MADLSFYLLILTTASFVVSFVFHLTSFLSREGKTHRAAFGLMRVGFLMGTFYFAAVSVESHAFIPVASLSEALTFFAWSLTFVYLVLLVRSQSEPFGLVLTPVLSALTIGACLSHGAQSGDLAIPDNPFFTVHIVSAFFAYACFAISFAAGVLYLIQHYELKAKKPGTFYHKLTSLEELEKLIYQPLGWGVGLLLLAVGIGFIWSKEAFGEYWLKDPKTIVTLITAGFYLVILYLRYGAHLRAKRGAVLTLVAFGLVILSFVGPRFIEGSHNYIQ